MTQDKIIEGLQKALAGGSGSLDDLDNLMNRVKQDIATAKKEQEEAEKKAKADAEARKAARGTEIAHIATRLLNEELTDADMALVMNVFFKQHGLQTTWTEKNIHELMVDCGQKVDELNVKAKQAVNELADLFESLFGVKIDTDKVKTETKKEGNTTTVKAEYKQPKESKDPDDVIRKFLSDFGLG
jgi:cellobiose-specific phosphotransferase system component IIA